MIVPFHDMSLPFVNGWTLFVFTDCSNAAGSLSAANSFVPVRIAAITDEEGSFYTMKSAYDPSIAICIEYDIVCSDCISE